MRAWNRKKKPKHEVKCVIQKDNLKLIRYRNTKRIV